MFVVINNDDDECSPYYESYQGAYDSLKNFTIYNTKTEDLANSSDPEDTDEVKIEIDKDELNEKI